MTAPRTKRAVAAWRERWKPVMLRRGVYNKIMRLKRRGETRGDVVLRAVRVLEQLRGQSC